jgi:hypothetical protein
MVWHLVESSDYTIEHRGRRSEGVVAEAKGSEKIYLHVVALTGDDIARLAPRIDENGNKEHARLALPREEAWWVAIDGEAFWPKLYRPRVASRCVEEGGVWRPVALSPDDLDRLRKAGVRGI